MSILYDLLSFSTMSNSSTRSGSVAMGGTTSVNGMSAMVREPIGWRERETDPSDRRHPSRGCRDRAPHVRRTTPEVTRRGWIKIALVLAVAGILLAAWRLGLFDVLSDAEKLKQALLDLGG